MCVCVCVVSAHKRGAKRAGSEESRSEPEEAAAAENCTWTCAVGPGIFTFPFFKEQLSLDLSLISKSKGQLREGEGRQIMSSLVCRGLRLALGLGGQFLSSDKGQIQSCSLTLLAALLCW